VPGRVFELTEDELIAADDYEVDDYQGILVSLASGVRAWVYVTASPAGPSRPAGRARTRRRRDRSSSRSCLLSHNAVIV
jgi:hypothetical protein